MERLVTGRCWCHDGQRIHKTFGTEETCSDWLLWRQLVLQAARHDRYSKWWFKWDTFNDLGAAPAELPGELWPILQFIRISNSYYELRGHNLKLNKKRSRLEVRRKFFSQSLELSAIDSCDCIWQEPSGYGWWKLKSYQSINCQVSSK